MAIRIPLLNSKHIMGTMAKVVLVVSIIFIGCNKSDLQKVESDYFPKDQDIPVSKTLSDFLVKERIKSITLIGEDTQVRFFSVEGKILTPCATNKEGELIITDPSRCGDRGPDNTAKFTGTLTNLNSVTIFVVEGANTKYCNAGGRTYPC